MNEIRRKPTREEIPPGEILCKYCTAKCCRYFALPIDTPETYEDFQYIRWYLMHDLTSVFVEEGTWYLLVQSECQHLLRDNRCGIYQTRPKICIDYSTDNCEYEDHWTYERLFETAEQVEEFCEAIFNQPDDPHFRSPRPAVFPILQTVPAESWAESRHHATLVVPASSPLPSLPESTRGTD